MLKLARRARGHFVTLIEIRVHLIRVKPGHISKKGVSKALLGGDSKPWYWPRSALCQVCRESGWHGMVYR